jgi:hypothetical protein
MVRLCVSLFELFAKAVPGYLLKDFILSHNGPGCDRAPADKAWKAAVDLEDEMLNVDGGSREPGEDNTQGNAPTFHDHKEP